MTEVPEVYRKKAEERLGNEAQAQGTSEADNRPYLEIPISPEEPGTIGLREGIHERLQADIHHKANLSTMAVQSTQLKKIRQNKKRFRLNSFL